MATDIKTLRIGSHVLVDGKRERVRGLDEDNGLIIRFPAEYVMACEVEPIPITAELLAELGFDWREDSSCWCKYQNYDGEHYDWGLYVSGKETGWQFSLFLPFEDWRRAPKFYARNLHEIEGQLAYYGVELIKE